MNAYENVKRVSSGESDFGLYYAVDSALGFAGKLTKDETKYDGLRALGYLYGAPAQLVVKADKKIKSAADLKGRRVAVGNAGSGAAASAFKDGKIDAFWVLVGYPNRSIIEASVQEKIRLMNVGLEAETSGIGLWVVVYFMQKVRIKKDSSLTAASVRYAGVHHRRQ